MERYGNVQPKHEHQSRERKHTDMMNEGKQLKRSARSHDQQEKLANKNTFLPKAHSLK